MTRFDRGYFLGKEHFKKEHPKPEWAKQLIVGGWQLGGICIDANMGYKEVKRLAKTIGWIFPEGNRMDIVAMPQNEYVPGKHKEMVI